MNGPERAALFRTYSLQATVSEGCGPAGVESTRLVESEVNVFSKADLGSPEWLAALTGLVQSLGRHAFEQDLMTLLNQILPIDHCVVFTYSRDGVGHLFTHGKMADEVAQSLADDYVNRFHERDPMFARLSDTADAGCEHPVALNLRADYDPAYRSHFFDRADLIDKASTVGRLEDGGVLCNFYRMGASGPYSQREWERLEQVLPLVTGLISAHYQLVGQALQHVDAGTRTSRTRSLVHTIIGKRVRPFDRLTLREREVCERILLGYTSIGIGLDLNIAPSSVLTYRKRAYQKLGISSQNELFSLCLGAAQGR